MTIDLAVEVVVLGAGSVAFVDLLAVATSANAGTDPSTTLVSVSARVLTANARPPAAKTATNETVVATDVFITFNLVSA